MNKKLLKILKESKRIKYIYRIANSLYKEGYEYIIIGDLSQEDFLKSFSIQSDIVRYFTIDDWFIRMQSGSLLPYVCSILSKANKIKEYLNIYSKPDLLAFRKLVKSGILSDNECVQECLWAIQIIKEYRVNRVNVTNQNYIKSDIIKMFLEEVNPIYKSSLNKTI